MEPTGRASCPPEGRLRFGRECPIPRVWRTRSPLFRPGHGCRSTRFDQKSGAHLSPWPLWGVYQQPVYGPSVDTAMAWEW